MLSLATFLLLSMISPAKSVSAQVNIACDNDQLCDAGDKQADSAVALLQVSLSQRLSRGSANSTKLGAVSLLGGPQGQDMKDLFDEQNVLRCMHDVPRFQWDDNLAKDAAAWAPKSNFEHDPQTGLKPKEGENLALTNNGVSTVIQGWYDREIAATNNGLVAEFDDFTGHYTQLVWKATTKVGCATYDDVTDPDIPGYPKGTKTKLWVCRYLPGGNVAGKFTQNVNSPVKTKSQCSVAQSQGRASESQQNPRPSESRQQATRNSAPVEAQRQPSRSSVSVKTPAKSTATTCREKKAECLQKCGSSSVKRRSCHREGSTFTVDICDCS